MGADALDRVNSARRDTRKAIVGLAVSNGGTWVHRVSLDLLLLAAGGPRSLAAGVALQQLPAAILFRPAGRIADRFDRRRLLVACDAALALLALVPAVLVWSTSQPSRMALLAFAAVSGVIIAVETTARHTLLGELVMAAQQPRLLGLSVLVPNVGRMVGPVVGAVVIASGGHGAAHVVNAASFAIALMLVAQMRTSSGARVGPADDAAGRHSLLATVRATGALPYVLLLWWTYLLTQGTRVYLPLLSGTTDATDYGLLLTLVGVGGGLGALATWRFEALAGDAVTIAAALALPVAVTALVARTDVLTCLGAVAIGIGTALLSVGVRVRINARTPEHLRGQHASVVVAAIQGSSPLSALITSWWVTLVGTSAGLLSMQSLAVAGIAAIVALTWRPAAPQ